MRSQILGDWTLTVGPASATRSSCGHARPDAQDHQPAIELADGASSKEVHVRFVDAGENKVLVRHTGQESYFSMVYDEGFEFDLEVDGQPRSFFAFSGFKLMQNHLVPTAKPQNISECGRTELGWYSAKDRSSFGCFYGKKDDFSPGAKLANAIENATNATEELAQAIANATSRTGNAIADATDPENVREFLARPAGSLVRRHARVEAVLDHAAHEARVALINKHAKTWTATAYTKYDGLSPAAFNALGGLRRPAQIDRPVLAAAQLDRTNAVERSLELVASLPEELDWRDIDGKDWIEPVVDQAACGSCYAVSTMRMLNARHRIQRKAEYNRTRELFSISFPLYCSEYNQGCNGGFSSLLSRWSQDVGLLPASCAPYSPQGKCDFNCPVAGQRWRADAHRYIGGYYGKANEGEMMLEVQQRGPITIGVRVAADFMYYLDGVYEGELLPPIQESDGWQEMQHAVVLVGWGVDKSFDPPLKYWTLQNSWGANWGEKGYMRIRRGENDSGVESSPEAADVVPDESNGARVASFFAHP